MFTIPIYIRFALIALFTIGGVILMSLVNFWTGFPLLLVAVVLFVGYVIMGTITSAAKLMQESRFDESDRRLGLTLSPKLLFKTNRAYYYLIKGTIAIQRKESDLAEDYFNEARVIGLPTDNERAMISLQLAGLQANKQKWTTAKNHLADAKKYKVTESQIKDQIEEFDKMFKQRGQLKHASGGMMQRGGKRKRPKMR